MDIFRKILGISENEAEDSSKKRDDNNRKQSWFDEEDFDNKTFGFRVFTNPGEIHEHLEKQIEEMMKLFDENSENLKHFDNEDFFKLKPGFKQHIEDFHKAEDSDLDDKAYGEQLKVLLDRIAPEHSTSASPSKMISSEKRNEDEQIMDRIHDTYKDPNPSLPRARPSRRRLIASPQNIPNGVFDGNGPRVFGQSIISQTIRRPDGSIETRRTIRDSEGHKVTTVTRSENGQTVQQITTYDDVPVEKKALEPPKKYIIELDQNLTVNPEGYSMPRNLW